MARPTASFSPTLLVALLLYGIFLFSCINLYVGYRCLRYLVFRDSAFFPALALLYAVWFAYDRNSPRNGAKAYRWLRGRAPDFARASQDYFPIRLHNCAGIDFLERPHLFGYHPHGILPFGSITMACGRQMPFGIRKTATIGMHFWIPIWRELALLLGFVDAQAASCEAAIRENGSLLIAVGGARESMDALKPACMLLTVRRGFFRLALRMGTPVVPILAFGELELFEPAALKESRLVRWIQRTVYRHVGLALPLCRGKRFWSMLPDSRPIDIYAGEPIEVIRSAHPAVDEVDQLRSTYCRQLEGMFERLSPSKDMKLVFDLAGQ